MALSAVALRAAGQSSCTYGVPVTAATASAAANTQVSIQVVAKNDQGVVVQSGCVPGWQATTDSTADVTLTNASGQGSGTVVATLTANTDLAPRLLYVSVDGIPVVIKQRGQACTYDLTAPPPLVPAAGGNVTLQVATQPNCAWHASVSEPFVRIGGSQSGTASASGLFALTLRFDPNPTGSNTRRAYPLVSDPTDTNFLEWQVYLPLVVTQAGQNLAAPTPWAFGDLFAGIGYWGGDQGRYRVMTPTGASNPANDLEDAFGGTALGCMIDPTVSNGDLWTTGFDGLTLSRFSSATHQLTAALRLTPSGLATVQRRPATVPVPSGSNVVLGEPYLDIAYSEPMVFDKTGNVFVGTAAYFSSEAGPGYAYLLKFAVNGTIAGCAASGPCLVDWWRVDSGGELPAGKNAAGTNAVWTSTYKSAYASAKSGGATDAAALQAAQSAVASLAPDLRYYPSNPDGNGQVGTAGVDELDLSSDGHTVFYTSEDGFVRKFDTESGTQLSPLMIRSFDFGTPVGGKAYGLRLLPNGDGTNADGGGGFIVAMDQGVWRVDSTGREIKPAGFNAISYDPTAGLGGGAHPFAVSLTPDAQSFWVATAQDWLSGTPQPAGGKIFRYHIASGTKYGPFDVGTADIQSLCVKREYLASVNVCYQTDATGKPVTDANGNPVPISCEAPAVCDPGHLGHDTSGQVKQECFPPGTLPKFTSAAVNQFSTKGVAVTPYTITAQAYDASRLPVTFSFSCSGTGCDTATGLPAGLSASANSSSDPANQQVTISGTPTASSMNTPIPITATVTDAAGAQGTMSFTWSVNAPPRIDPISDQKTYVGASVAYPVVVTDDDNTQPLSVSVTGLPPGVTYSGGQINGTPTTGNLSGYVVKIDATDGLGAKAEQQQFTWVVDTRPVFPLSPPIPDQTWTVLQPRTYQVVVRDPDSGDTLKFSATGLPVGVSIDENTGAISGTPIVTGVYDVTVSVTDAFMRNDDPDKPVVSATFKLTVSTNQQPDCTLAAPSIAAIWPPDHKMVAVRVVGVTDPDGNPVTITVQSVWQDEPVLVQGSGKTSFDAIIEGSFASVRAERTGKADGRVYQINFTATDGQGGSCTGSVRVGVPHDQSRMTMPTFSGTWYNSIPQTP